MVHKIFRILMTATFKSIGLRLCVVQLFSVAALILISSPVVRAAITGQWDFKSGDLSATVGRALEYYDSPGGETEQKTVFGTTAELGLPDIGGAPAHVMGFPRCLPTMGYVMYPEMQPNGGGNFVNQYTLIFDLLYPPESASGWRALVQIDDLSNSNDADLFINQNGGIGISGAYHGQIKPNQWHRVAFVFDLAAPGGPSLTKYIDGELVGQQILNAGVDGRWALNPIGGMFGDAVLLFTDDNADGGNTQPGFVSSIQVHDVALSAAYIKALGAPTTDGIPREVVVPASITSRKPSPNAMNVSPGSQIEAVIADGSAPLDTSTIIVKVNGQVITRTVSSIGGQHTVRATLPTLPPRSQATATVEFVDPARGQVTEQWTFRIAPYELDSELEQVLTSELVAYWKMDDGLKSPGTTLMLDETRQNSCTITAGLPDYWLSEPEARFGGALHVDGENVYVVIPPSPSLDINTNALTVSLWVKLEQLPSQLPGSYGSIYDSVTDEYVIYTDKGNKELRFKVTLANGQAARPGIPESMLKLGEWMHIVAVYDGNASPTAGEARIYLNGELIDTHVGHDGAPGTGLKANVRAGQTAAIGRPGTQASNYYVGSIDDIAIWRQALTVDAIGYLSSGHPVPFVGKEPEPLSIAQHPQDKTALVGTRVMFEVVVSGGTPPITYQWKRDGVAIPDATSSKLFVRVEPDSAGTYTVEVRDSLTSIESNPAKLTIAELPSDPAESLLWGLKAHWKFDDGLIDPLTQTVADTVGTSNGNLFGGNPDAWLAESQAKFTGALHVDGQNVYVTIPSTTALDIGENQVSISLWTKLEQLPSELPGSYGGIYDSSSDCYIVYLDRNNRELRFKITTVDGHAARPGIPETDLVLNEWVHIVGVYDGNASQSAGEARIYLNGELKDTHIGHDSSVGTGLTGTVQSGQVAGIGRDGANAQYFFTGAVDDIAVWGRALTQAEIAYLSAGHPVPSAVQPAPLVISSTTIQGGRIVIQWTGGKGPFQLQRRSSLTEGTWENVGEPVTGTSASDSVDAQMKFYRVLGAQ